MLAMLLSLVALGYYARRGYLLLYGDAVAHLHIARRIFDSQNPGFRQLGSVWLPLPHLLLLPFVQKMSWWRNGMAGAVPSVVSYIAGCVGIFRLSRFWLPLSAAAVATLFFSLNPGLVYLSTTAMNEPLFLAEMVWAVVLLAEVSHALSDLDRDKRAARLVLYLALVLSAAVFTRYDGWVYAAAAWVMGTWIVLKRKRWTDRSTGAWVLLTVTTVVSPLLWIAYNAKQFHDPFDFLRGPYSAKAIDLRTARPGSPHYPGYHDIRVAALYFLKTAKLDAVWMYAGWLVISLAVVGSWVALRRYRDGWMVLLLWLPLFFYSYSVAFGSVPIFIPVWRPHSFYNTRYGMEMLPAFSMFLGFAVAEGARLLGPVGKWVPVAAGVLILANAAALQRARPLVLREAMANGRSRIAFEHALAMKLADLPPTDQILMYTSAHVGAIQQAGIPLKQTLNEGDDWRWRRALLHPATAAPWVVAVDGDAVANALAAHPEDLDLLSVTCSTDQGCARIYHSRALHAAAGGQG